MQMIEKAFENESGHPYVLGRKKVRFFRFFGELQADLRSLLNEDRVLLG